MLLVVKKVIRNVNLKRNNMGLFGKNSDINPWNKIEDIDFFDLSINQYHIDTRDFHCICDKKMFNKDKFEHPFDYDIIKQYPNRFFHTPETIKKIIDRFYLQSGGVGDWRMFNLITDDENALYWNAKYLRIYRTELGLCICNSRNKALKLSTLMCDVQTNHLNHYIK